MTFRHRSSICAIAALVLSLSAASTASADQATAEALFRNGKELMGQNQFDQACGKFRESQNQDPQLGTLLALADCYSKAGKTALEWAAYNQVAFEAKKRGDTARAEAAAAKAASLEPNLSKLTIQSTDAGTPGLQIRRDGEDVGKGALGTAIPVDAGSHVIEATAPGYEVWQTTVTVGANRDIKNVMIPALTKKPDGADGGGSAPNPTRRNIGFVVGGVGVAGLVLGGVMGGLALSDKSSADKLCGADKTCGADGRAKVDSANTKALVSTIGFGVGIAGVGAGIALILTSRGHGAPAADEQPAPAAPAARLIPSIGPQGGGLTVLGTF